MQAITLIRNLPQPFFRNLHRPLITSSQPHFRRCLSTTTTSPMNAIISDDNGGISLVRRPIPMPKDDEYLLKVAAFGVNRADILQTLGKYPPPTGTTDVLGLEAAGYLENGELVAALLTGGAYAEYATVPKSAVLRFPVAQMDAVQLAAIPEAFLAAYHVLFQMGALVEDECVYINAAGSGVGTAAIQLAATVPGVKIIASAGCEDKLRLCRKLGAHAGINYKTESISDQIGDITANSGANLAVDCVGAAQFRDIQRALSADGRWVMYGFLSGAKITEANLAGIVMKRLQIMGTTLRSRSVEYRGDMIQKFMQRFGGFFAEGTLKTMIDRRFDGLQSVSDALEYMKENRNTGKIVVTI